MGKLRHTATRLVRMLQFKPRVARLASAAQVTQNHEALAKTKGCSATLQITSKVHESGPILQEFLHCTHSITECIAGSCGAIEFMHR